MSVQSDELFYMYMIKNNDVACIDLTLRPPSTCIVPYANSLDPDETRGNSASHQDPSCLTLEQHFHQL